MPNNYISRYAKHDTHFQRTDPFRFATWGDENQKENISIIVLSSLGFILTLVTLLWL